MSNSGGVGGGGGGYPMMQPPQLHMGGGMGYNPLQVAFLLLDDCLYSIFFLYSGVLLLLLGNGRRRVWNGGWRIWHESAAFGVRHDAAAAAVALWDVSWSDGRSRRAHGRHGEYGGNAADGRRRAANVRRACCRTE